MPPPLQAGPSRRGPLLHGPAEPPPARRREEHGRSQRMRGFGGLPRLGRTGVAQVEVAAVRPRIGSAMDL